MEDNHGAKKIKLKPVVYTTASRYQSGYQNTTQQMFLLKALKVTQDPKQLRDMLGVKTVAEVYKTLDKLAMRKEYHSALSRLGISFDYIAGGIKGIADSGEKDSDRLKAFQTLLKSTGMDVYKEDTTAITGTWEEVLLARIEASKEVEKETVKKIDGVIQYEVIKPKVPESARLAQEDEEELTSNLYDTKPI